MASRAPRSATAKLPGIEIGQITNFSGGPNFRDSPTEIAGTESYSAYNTTFDERGGVQSRLGFAKRNLTPLGAGYKAQVLASTPTLYWRLDEGVGALTALDASGNGNTGAYGTGVTLGQPGALTGDSDKAALLDGTANDSITATSYQPFVAGSTRTFMGWANRTAVVNGALFSGAGSFPSLVIQGTGSDVWFNTGSAVHVAWASAWPGLSQWVHWALTYNDTTKIAELFINGVSKGQLTIASGYAGNGLLEVGIGRNGGQNAFFGGAEDEFTVFEAGLSAATITGIYSAGSNSGELVVNDYYSPLLGVTLTQCGKSLYKADAISAVKTFTTKDCVTFAELAGKVVVGHPVDGLWYTTDGTSWTHITSANAPATANCICTWLSKLFVGMSDGSVHWSNASDPLTWTSTDFNAIWTKDQKPIVALAVASGQDIQGRPGLLAFKQDSVYRINDSGTGSYTVVDTSHGAAGPKAVVGVGARVCWIGKGGIWWWREDQASPVNASDLLRPAWRNDELSFGNQLGWAAGRRLNRAYFSVSSLNSTANDMAFEFHPDEEWVVPRSDATTCYSVDANENTYGGSPSAPGQVYTLDTSGTDDGANITGWFQTRWLVPNGGFKAQVWQARLHGRGSGTMTFRTDYEDSGGKTYAFNFATGGFLYDNGVLYDSGATYSAITLAETEEFDGLGACRQFSLRFDFTVNSTVAGRTLFGNIPVQQQGAFALYGVETPFIPLGLS